jgi:uncharacterized protein
VTVYLDTSAAAKLLVTEQESDVLTAYLANQESADRPASSMLLETELRRFALRIGLAQSAVSDVLARIDLVEPDRSLFTEAGLIPGANLRSLDALHVATALRLEARVVVAYEQRLQQAARAVGLATAAPTP